MDYPNDNTALRKNKHLNFEERMTIQLRIKDGFTSYKISKELGRPINTIINEIRHGTTTQIKLGKTYEVVLCQEKVQVKSGNINYSLAHSFV